MVEWFHRFGDIPGVTFIRDPGLDPSKLIGYSVAPEQHAYEVDGENREYIEWSYGDSRGSASPAHSRAFQDQRDASSADVLQNCFEGLELPGEPSDFHFLIQGSANELWRRRREEPSVLEEIEHLCWLDLQLVDAYPTAVTNEYSEDRPFYAIEAFSILINLFEREGALREALEVAERAAHYGQGTERRDQLVERVVALENEARG
jgi:hypothetical protein